jgi:saccharopine dehydrogenase-like NADP-dependent oxidoreductase
MNRVLVIGAGRVAPPLVRYLLNLPGVHTTVCDARADAAAALVVGHARARAVELSIQDVDRLLALVREHDVAVSLLPAPLHPHVAELCVRHGKHLVTTSYVGPAMRALDGPARAAGAILLNEVGLDPGIDHMSAMQVIDGVRKAGGRVASFISYCGGLPAPDANDNPWGYKFSWSPRGVLTAGKNGAVFLRGGRRVEIPPSELFLAREPVTVDGVPGWPVLEGYPNRDSLGYVSVYGLDAVETMLRGTLRYPGWCETMKAVVDLGLLDETPTVFANMSLAEWLGKATGAPSAAVVRAHVQGVLGQPASSPILKRLEWLGLFSSEPIPGLSQPATALDLLAARMERLMAYQPNERDMVVMQHQFIAEQGGKREKIVSTLVQFGEPGGDSAMARTVGLPAAIATRLILERRLTTPGVQVPVAAPVYEPILTELGSAGVRFVERRTAL